ncbi:hypothetical protein V492_00589 [Pseudogymnoascus sp. VKM F-4246]|nr:hypothetical protein V492_00589 [Pseudogymnoascus sp. VKM F-4246]
MASDKWNEMLSSAKTNFTWLNTINDGPSPVICPEDAHGEIDLTSELDSVFAKLQKNIKRLQYRVNLVDSINRKLFGALILQYLKTSADNFADEWTKAEKTANDMERENQRLRIENSRLAKEASRANRKSTVELGRDEFVGGWHGIDRAGRRTEGVEYCTAPYRVVGTITQHLSAIAVVRGTETIFAMASQHFVATAPSQDTIFNSLLEGIRAYSWRILWAGTGRIWSGKHLRHRIDRAGRRTEGVQYCTVPYRVVGRAPRTGAVLLQLPGSPR